MMSENPFGAFRAEYPDNPVAAAILGALRATPLKGRPGSVEALYVVHFGDVADPIGLVNGGVVVLETGRVFGGDSGYFYAGSYRVEGEALQGTATVERHNAGWQSVWGDEEQRFDIEFTGQRCDGGAVIEGRMRRLDMPSSFLPLMWFRMRDLP